MEQSGAQRPEVTITPCADGPLLVRGAVELRTQDGELIDPGRATIALCRCGRSAIKPFCDGSHKVAGFRAPSGPLRDPLRPEPDSAG
ncbi:CDGSH iron-sulfur domain-containing protein [Crossiella cryophila]|uniref:CDGSH-type Zn-finger protein n=1 Tax=Crossiella cryophila TaxID=43355 RepID=A0A7W7CEY8_9PSEU|nr:CDGSH iron-sulfur domain-containing protein [Crossiella cryophila]MBB4679977.1 CDGSH-type Zn-finger protein [Crossiella cryophila]